VIDRFANAIPGLAASDFRLRVDGRETAIETVDWIPSQVQDAQGSKLIATGRDTADQDSARRKAEIAGPAAETTAPRTLVMLFQWEIAGQKDTGFVRMMRQAKRMVESSTPEDRIAVLAFGSSLRLLQDFTNDHAALRDAIEAVRSWNYHGHPAAAGPTLAGAIADCGSRNSIQKAIVCAGSALQTLPGSKTLLFFGWTIARASRATRYIDYPAMIEAISKARTSVFVLDVSDGHHSLELGLKQLAADTGGLYNGGCLYEMMYCADLATAKTQRAVGGGTYEIVFRDPTTTRGWHEVEVQLTTGKGIAVFARWYRI
jgi:VWFA-related protein